ncbi:MAG: hypothetical protein WBZ36_05305 [Candidatus Nitrosopolaris sp.]
MKLTFLPPVDVNCILLPVDPTALLLVRPTTSKANLTISVIPPLTANETFTAFWVTYGTPIVILAGGAVGASTTFLIGELKSRREHKQQKS